MAQHNSDNTVFLFVGGVSHTPIFFEALVKEMESRGYSSHAFDYPTIGANTEHVTQQDEYQAIQKVINIYAEQDKYVVLVGHSYGGWPASRAVKGWDKESRTKTAEKGGVKELVFISGFCVPDNADMKMYSFLPPWIDVRVRIRCALLERADAYV
jgi:alpha-beta hydrolase superfamily lysophospholipase